MAASLAENFDEFFEIKLADTQDLKNESYKIRHTVYAQELGWEPISPNGMEIDECDPYVCVSNCACKYCTQCFEFGCFPLVQAIGCAR